MKNKKNIAVICALVMIFVGALMAVLSLASIDFRLSDINPITYSCEEHTFREHFWMVSVEGKNANVSLLPSEDNVCRVEFDRSKNITYEVYIEKGCLTVKRVDYRPWYQRIGIFLEKEQPVAVYLPKGSYSSLSVTTDEGNILLDKGVLCEIAILKSISGDIAVHGITTWKVSAEAVSGNILLASDTGRNVALTTASGRIQMTDIDVLDVKVKSTDGTVEMENVNGMTLSVLTVSGEAALDSVAMSESAEIETQSGNIAFRDLNVAGLSLRTGSGNVAGTLLFNMNYLIDAASGEVSVPGSNPLAGTCEIVTAGGDVTLGVSSEEP